MLLFVYTIGIGFLDWNAVGGGWPAESVCLDDIGFWEHGILGTWHVAEKKAVDLG